MRGTAGRLGSPRGPNAGGSKKQANEPGPRALDKLDPRSAGNNAMSRTPNIHPTASVDPSAHVDATARIGAECRVERDAIIERGATLEDGSWTGAWTRVGRNSQIGKHARIGYATTLQNGVRIGAFTRIGGEAIIGAEATIGQECELENNVKIHSDPESGERTGIGAGAALGAGTRVGQGSTVGERVSTQANVHIGPECTIGDDTAILRNVDLGTRTTVGRACLIDEGTVTQGSCRINAGASIGRGVTIGPLSEIGANSEIGQESELGAGCSIHGGSFIGERNRLGTAVKTTAKLVTMSGVQIGDRTELNHATVIGCDAQIGARTKSSNVELHITRRVQLSEAAPLPDGGRRPRPPSRGLGWRGAQCADAGRVLRPVGVGRLRCPGDGRSGGGLPEGAAGTRTARAGGLRPVSCRTPRGRARAGGDATPVASAPDARPPVANAPLTAGAGVPVEVARGSETGLDGVGRRLRAPRRGSGRRRIAGVATLLPRLGLEPEDLGAKLRLGARVGGLPLRTPVFRQLGPRAVSHGVRLAGANQTLPAQLAQVLIIDRIGACDVVVVEPGSALL